MEQEVLRGDLLGQGEEGWRGGSRGGVQAIEGELQGSRAPEHMIQ